MKLEDATPPQREAITSTAGTILVVAGPGAGKSATTIARIERLIDDGADPRGIVAITFTNAGAKVLQERLVPKLGQHNVSLGFAGTLHGFSLRMLKQHGKEFGYGDRMSIINPESAEDLLVSKATTLGCKLKLKDLQQLKAKGRPARGTRMDIPTTVIASYYDDLQQAGIVDFDILLTEFARLIPELTAWPFAHLFVDEVQDSAPIDWQIYHALPIPSKFMVGDSDQSIYGFRGASLDGMLELANRADTHLIKLEDNFRSTSEICEAAQNLIEHNRERIDKRTVSHSGPGGHVTVQPPAVTEGEELGMVTRAITDYLRERDPLMRGDEMPEIAVLCRTNAMAFAAQQTLTAAGLPVIQRTKSDQPEDWPLVRSYVELLANPENDTLAYFYLLAKYQHTGANPKEARDIVHSIRRAAAAAGKSINRANLGYSPVTNAVAVLGSAINASISLESRMLLSEIVREIGPESSPLELALALGGRRESVKEEPGEGIHVLTIHASKGREFDAVFLMGWEDEVMCGRSKTPADIEDDRRLAYVALTRARSYVMITGSKTRTTSWGAIAQHSPSRFIAELSKEIITFSSRPFCCPDCNGAGWFAKYPNNGDPPEQVQCEKCCGTGSLDPRIGDEP